MNVRPDGRDVGDVRTVNVAYAANPYLTIPRSSATDTIMVFEANPRAYSTCNRRRSEWRLAAKHAHPCVKRSTAIVANMLWGLTALP
jgi:hypothetical protein